jgi:hypothetical protein
MVRTTNLVGYSDVHYTDPDVAKYIIDFYRPKGAILEPFRGGGVFFDQLPEGSDWTEIQEGRDFLEYKKKVDWIITNPPFEKLTDMMSHAFEICKNTVFLVPLSKIYSSAPRMDLVLNKAGIKRQLYLGSGRKIGFDIGFPFAAMEFERGYKGPVTTIDGTRFVNALNVNKKAQN